MIRLRVALLLTAIAALIACPTRSRAQDTVTTHTVKMVMVQADLSQTLDAKKATQGEAVTAKLLYEAKIPDVGTWPRNTVLSGHVNRVQASENKSDSLIEITFDKAILKDGKVVPIKATIMKLHALKAPNGEAESDVKLQSSVQDSSSATFQSAKKNVHIAGGTDMDIAVGVLPANSAAQ